MEEFKLDVAFPFAKSHKVKAPGSILFVLFYFHYIFITDELSQKKTLFFKVFIIFNVMLFCCTTVMY